MTEQNQMPTYSYHAFCLEEAFFIEKFLYDCDNPGPEDILGFKGRAEHAAGISRKEPFGLSYPSTGWTFATALEDALIKKAIGSATFQVDPEILASQDLQADLGILFTECSSHISLYRRCDCYFTFTEALGVQVVAQQEAFKRLALSPLIQTQFPGKFDEVLGLFDLMAGEGRSDYWYLAILCKSSGCPRVDYPG